MCGLLGMVIITEILLNSCLTETCLLIVLSQFFSALFSSLVLKSKLGSFCKTFQLERFKKLTESRGGRGRECTPATPKNLLFTSAFPENANSKESYSK